MYSLVRSQLLMVCVLSLLTLSGCGPEEYQGEPYNPEDYSDQIDRTQPAASQLKQSAVKVALDDIFQGTSMEYIEQYHPSVKFEENASSFYGQHLEMARWKFNGPPQGSDVPVTIFWKVQLPPGAEPQAGQPTEIPEDRTYHVSGSGPYKIERKR
ncbi:Hypothetical protein PBC10988_18280 [Planctomycetales bacterium 10988]|nr:Hypothetical protein PBC10988_18280 [Planctomycetales bacterium 10988]